VEEEDLDLDVTASPMKQQETPGGSVFLSTGKNFQKKISAVIFACNGSSPAFRSSVAVQAALLQQRAVVLGEERVDTDPQQ
jgi:hypothetical protein